MINFFGSSIRFTKLYFSFDKVSALVTILKHLNNKTEITNIFTSAIDHFNAKNTNSKEFEIYTRENSAYQIETGNWQKASEMLEKMYQLKPNDFKILSKLINIYSKFDAQKANKYSFFSDKILLFENKRK